MASAGSPISVFDESRADIAPGAAGVTGDRHASHVDVYPFIMACAGEAGERRQSELIALNGGRDAAIARGDLGFSVPPGVEPDFD